MNTLHFSLIWLPWYPYCSVRLLKYFANICQRISLKPYPKMYVNSIHYVSLCLSSLVRCHVNKWVWVLDVVTGSFFVLGMHDQHCKLHVFFLIWCLLVFLYVPDPWFSLNTYVFLNDDVRCGVLRPKKDLCFT